MLISKYKHKLNYLYNRKKKNAGRNNTGHITVSHQGGGHKRKYRLIDWKNTFNSGHIINFEYDPNRSTRIVKGCFFQNKKKRFFYVLAPQNLNILDSIENSFNDEIFYKNNDDVTNAKLIGSCYHLYEFAVGDYIYNIELIPRQGGKMVRAGGSSAVILQKTDFFVLVKLPSGEHRLFPSDCKAFFGNLSNENHSKIIWKKAGKSRWLNIRPTVRGVAKNPIDHPHGGNTSGGCHPVTPWAKLTKGKPTRSKKKKNSLIIKSRKILDISKH